MLTLETTRAYVNCAGILTREEYPYGPSFISEDIRTWRHSSRRDNAGRTAYAQGKRTLTMVTSWPRGFAVLDDAATYLNNMVNEMSDGTLTIDKKAPGELVGAFEVFDAVSSGQADMYHSADYYFIGQHPGMRISPPFHSAAQRKN